MTTLITLTNDFHNTSINLRPGPNGELSDRQVARARRALCGVSGCTCGGTLGERGRNDWEVVDVDTRRSHVRTWAVRVAPILTGTSDCDHDWQADSTTPAGAGSQGYGVRCVTCGATGYQGAGWYQGSYRKIGEVVID